MPTATVPNAGTFDLEVDTGYVVDGFTLDSTIRGVLNDPNYVLDGTTNFASITGSVINVGINRGRRDPADQFPTGTMTFTLNDTAADGVFNPFDTQSPYYDDIVSYPGLAPGRDVRLTRYDASNNPERLFVGQIVNYEYQYDLSGNDVITVLCADGLYRLASTQLTEHNPSKEFTGARINAILDRAEVAYPTGAARSIAAGTVELGGSSQYAIGEGTTVKSYFDQITYSAERGRIFVDRDGVLVSQDRIGNTLSAPVVTFCDDSTHTTHARYNQLGITFKAEDIINRVAITPSGGSQQVANDTGSQTEYLIKALYIDNSLLHDDGAALTLANYLLFPEAEPRFNQVQTQYARLSAALRDSCAIVDIGDTVIITKQVLVAGVPTNRSQESSVEGVEHRISFDSGMVSRYYTSPTNIVYGLILNDSVFGILNSNALV
jgi:hypothetical protein